MIQKATRQATKPLVCFYAESGCGKTFSALLLARGFVGPHGRIVLADSEQGRGQLYADVIEGGYDVRPMDKFAPSDYIECVDEVENSGAAIGILDSGSHEWEGIGGVLEMAGDNEERTKKPGLHNWKTPKMEHQKFVQRLLRAKIPWIICLRAKYKSRQGKDEKGKTIIVKDDFTSPIQAEDFIFEMLVHGEIMPDHKFRMTKHSHPRLKECFPVDGMIEPKHGALLAKWCNSAGDSPELAKLKSKLWKETQAIHGGDKQKLLQWLCDEMLIAPDQGLETITAEQISTAIQKIPAHA